MISRITLALVLFGASFQAAQAQSFGRTPGQFSVSNVGSAVYSIPIFTPPGIGAVAPKLSLVYDSHASYGIVGPGWQLSGLSAISRCNLTYAQDGQAAPISLDSTDGLCLDGNRLRYTGTGAAGTGILEYQTEIANFSLISAVGTAGNGPSFFEVQTKDGLIYEYGNTPDSKVFTSGLETTPYIWALNRVSDLYGNFMTFTYAQGNGTYVPISIQYTSVANGTTFPYQINFAYSTKSTNDTLSRYFVGTQLQQANQLASITITHTGTPVHQYKLSYTTSSATLRARLTSIQECGGGASNDCLPATTVQYQDGVAGVASPSTATGSGATTGMVYSVDIDGDGKQDLVFATTNGSNYQWWVQLATASGYGTPINTGILAPATGANIVLDDFDADGRTEIMAPISGTWYVYHWNGTGFTATSTGLGVGTLGQGQAASADLDGDGLPELVTISGSIPTYTMTAYRNATSGGVISFAAGASVFSVSTTSGPSPTIRGNNGFPNASVKHMHFLGTTADGVALSFVAPAGSQGGAGPQVWALVGDPSQLWYSTSVAGTFATVLPGNFNDDACTDLYSGPTIAIAGCNGGNPVTYSTGTSSPIVATLDWDGDGRTDMLVSSGNLYRSEATKFAPAVASGISIGSGSWAVTDQNGDGLDDLVFANSSASNAIYYGVHNGVNIKPDLATSFVDGYGNSARPTFAPLTQSGFYTNYADAIAGYKNYIGPLYVVNQTIFNDPSNMPSGTYNQQYSYYGAWTNLQGRGFTGFEQVQRYDSRNSLWENFFNDVKFPYVGIVDADEVTQDQARTKNVKFSWINRVSTLLDSTPFNQRYFVYINHSTLQNYEVGGAKDTQLVTTTATSYTFDNYGNATDVSTSVTDNDTTSPTYGDTWTSDVVNTITPNTSQSWCVNLPTQTTVTNSSTAPGGAAITRTVQYNSPDYLHCRETEKVTEPASGLYKVTEDYTYDPATGNLTNHSITGLGLPARSTKTSWNSTAQFPVTVTNPLSQSITFGFDASTGNLTSVSDLNSTTSNPLATSWTYDNFGRKTLESRLDGTSTTWAYSNCATAGCVNANNKVTVTATVKNVGGSTLTTTNTYLDSLERPLITSGLMLNGAFDRQEVQYDNLGRVHNQGAPSTFAAGTAYWTTFGYDALNRLTSVQRPTSATVSTPVTTQYQYQGRTTTITDPPTTAAPSGRVTTKITLPTGRLARTQDNSGYNVNFGYDAFGSLLSVIDSSSPAITLFSASYAYGIGAYQVSSTDADLGKWTRVYDALGELTSYVDAKGQNFSFLYDKLSRATQRTEPDQAGTNFVTNWNWGNSAASFNIGNLQSVTATSSPGTYSEAYVYDSKTRLSTKTIVIPGDASYTYTQTYNSSGLLDTLQYPVSTSSYQMLLKYNYTDGILQKISDITAGGPGTTYWTANATNPRGQTLQETLGNSVIVNHAFDAVTSFVQNIQAGPGGGSALQNNTYQFDAVGNLIQRQDNNTPGITENVFPDALYRLGHTVGDTNTQMSYDAMGRIKTWEAYGATANITNYSTPQSGCTYYPDHAQPHAVRSSTQGAWTSSFCYDANGNMTTFTINGTNEGTYTWTSFNQPNDLSSGSSFSQFNYDANHQRYKQFASYSGAVETTIYVGGLLEKMSNSSGTAYRHYIPAGNNFVVYTRLSTGSNATYYVTKDHLGSSAVITDQTGDPPINEKFSALGWNETSTTGPATVSRHGFTGQEGLDNIGMVNMNGRVYQSSGSYFLSPDPFIPDPGNTQSFNRYAYVNNNPLSLIDPTGYDDEPLQYTRDAPPRADDPTLAVGYSSNPLSDTYTGSHIPGVNGLSPASCFGSCAGFYSTYVSNVSFADAHTTVQRGNLISTRFNTEAYAGTTQNVSTFLGSFWDDGTWHPVGGVDSFSFGSGFFLAPTSPDRGAVVSVAGPVEFAAFGVPGLLRSAVAGAVTNPVPGILARVVPGSRTLSTLGRAGETDVFVTAADDIAGLNSTQLAQRLAIDPSKSFTIVRFPAPAGEIASPVFRSNPGFLQGGLTRGGAREFVIPNGPIPAEATIEVVGP
jgi:RHS repeat-associated protein